MRRNLLLAAAGMAALVLTAQLNPWRGVSIFTPTGYANVTNAAFYGIVSAGAFVGSGTGLTGIGGGTNGYADLYAETAAVTRATIGRAVTSNLYPILVSGSTTWSNTITAHAYPWHLRNQINIAGESAWLRATNSANRVGGDGSWLYNVPWAGITGAPPIAASADTNWWAVFEIPNEDDRWFDLTLKASTNGFATDFLNGDSKVFIYTTAEPALNGTPAWERFETNWYPRVFYYFDHDYNHLSVWNPNAVNPNGTSSIHDSFEAEPGVLNPPVVKWVVMLKAQGPVNPTNWLSWAYLRQSNTDSEVTPAEGRAYWRATVPIWVTYDPRPRLHPGHPFYPALTNQHQRP